MSLNFVFPIFRRLASVLGGLLLLSLLSCQPAWSAAGNTATQYTSIHLIPITRTFIKNGQVRSFSTASYRDSYNFVNATASSAVFSDSDITGADISGIIACSLNISNYAGCANQVTGTGLTSMDFGNALFETLQRAKGAVDRDIAHVKVWLPAGTIATPLSIFATQQAQTQFLARLDSPPQGAFPKNIASVKAESSLSSLLAGKEVIGYNSPGGGSFQFSFFGDSMSPLPAGRWLYMDWYLTNIGYDGSGDQQPLGRMNGNIGLKNDPFQVEYKRQLGCHAFDALGDPIVLVFGCSLAAFPAPVIVTPSTSSATSSILLTGTQDAQSGSTSDPVMIDIYLDGVKTARFAVSNSVAGASWSQKIQLPTIGAHILYAVASNSSLTSVASNAITVLSVPEGSVKVTTLNSDGASGVSASSNSTALNVAGSFALISKDVAITTTIDVLDASTAPETKVCSAVTVSNTGDWSCNGTLAVGKHTLYALAKIVSGSISVTQSSARLTYSVLPVPADFGVKVDPHNASLQGLTLTVANNDVGKRVALFVAVMVDGELYFVTPNGIVSYRDLSAKNLAGTIPSFSVYLATTTSGKFVYDVLPANMKNLDLTRLVKTPGSDRYAAIQVIAGYGVVNSDADLSVNFKASGNLTDALSTMLRNGTFQSILN